MKRWYYFYTPDYAFWHEHLTGTLSPYFSLHPIEISPESLHLNEDAGHHFKGCSIKLDLVIDCISKNMGQSILFSDCTLFVNSANAHALKSYIDGFADKSDLVFADNAINSEVNIGFMLISCNERTLSFWQGILASFSKTSWDQALVNGALTGSTEGEASEEPIGLSWGKFDQDKIVCGYQFDERYREAFLLYKQFVRPSTKVSNSNQRMTYLNEKKLISDEVLQANLIQAG